PGPPLPPRFRPPTLRLFAIAGPRPPSAETRRQPAEERFASTVPLIEACRLPPPAEPPLGGRWGRGIPPGPPPGGPPEPPPGRMFGPWRGQPVLPGRLPPEPSEEDDCLVPG